MVNPAAQAHRRCHSPHQSTAGERHDRSAALAASIAWFLIAVWSTASLEIDMSKPHLLLIHCPDGIPAGAKGRQRGRSFRPLVVRGGARARSVPRRRSGEAAFELIDLGFLVSHASYVAFRQAGGQNGANDAERLRAALV